MRHRHRSSESNTGCIWKRRSPWDGAALCYHADFVTNFSSTWCGGLWFLWERALLSYGRVACGTKADPVSQQAI
jgi:hypothetical protein